MPHRKTLYTTLAACLLVAAGCSRNASDPAVSSNTGDASGSTENLVVNGGFEDGDLTPWVASIHAGQERFLFEFDGSEKREGAHSLRITSVDAGPWGVITQEISVPESPEGSKIRLSFQMRGLGTATSGEAHMLLRGSDLHRLETFPVEHPSADFDWHTVVWELPLSPNARNLELGITHNGAGTVWIDDVQLLIVPQ